MDQVMNIKVETASRHSEDLADAPANVLVIQRDEIRARHYRNLSSLLNEIPGFHIQRRTSSTKYDRVAWRGHYGNNKFLLLLDGVRIGDPAGGGIAIADNFDLRHIDRVEVVYGPASALYGADAAAGVINLISDAGGVDAASEIVLTTGSNHYRKLGALSHVALGDAGTLTLAGHGSRDDTTDLSRYFAQDFAAVNATTFGGAVVVPAAQREHYVSPVSDHAGFARFQTLNGLSIGIYHNRNKHLSSIGETPKGVIYNPNSYWQQDITTFHIRQKTMLSSRLESNTLFDMSRLEIAPGSSFQNRYTDFKRGYQFMRNERIELDQQFSYDFNNQTNTTFGFSWGNYHSIPKTADTPFPVDPNRAIAGQRMLYPNTTIPIQFYDIRYRHLGLFSQWQHHWNKQWLATAGLRYDHDSRYGSSWNPRLSVVYQASAAWTWKLMYGEAFRAPSTVETHESFGSFSGATNAAGQYTSGFFHLPNPQLKPEKTRSAELLLQGSPSPTVYTSLSLFYSRINNVIFAANTTTPLFTLPNAAITTIETNQNLGRERFYGLEWYVHQEQALNHGIKDKLWLSYSYLDGRLDAGKGGTTSEIPYISKQHLRLGVNLLWHQWDVGTTAHFVGKANTNKADPLNPTKKQKVAAYALYDLHITVNDLVKVGQLNIEVNNLFDRRYWHANGGGIKFLGSQQAARTIAASWEMKL
jgi:outer membrane receptor for ferrienterochelin and colicin